MKKNMIIEGLVIFMIIVWLGVVLDNGHKPVQPEQKKVEQPTRPVA